MLSLKEGCFYLVDIGLVFVSNGSVMLKIKNNMLEKALNNKNEAYRLVGYHPDFFHFISPEEEIKNLDLGEWEIEKKSSFKLNEMTVRLALVSLPYGEGPQVVMPLGLQNISSYVKKNSDVSVVVSIFDYSDEMMDNKKILDEVFVWNPDAIGFSVYSSHVKVALEWGEEISKKIPGCFVFCGGPHISLAAEHFITEGKNFFNLAIKGEGEYSTLRLVELIFNKKKGNGDLNLSDVPNAIWYDKNEEKIIINKMKKYQLPVIEWANPLLEYDSASLQKLYFTDRHDGIKRKAIAFTSSRGCPLTCSFCAIIAADNEGPRWRAAEASTLLDWIEEAKSYYDFSHVYMMDANFFVKKNRVIEFSEGLYQRFNGEITWSSSSTVGYLLRSVPDLPRLKKFGLRLVEMGIESGSQSQLNYMNKRVTVEQNIKAVRELQNNNIDVGLDFIMFYHDQNKREIKENLYFLYKANLTEYANFDHYLNIMMLYPGTPVRSDLEKKLKRSFDLQEMPTSRHYINSYEVQGKQKLTEKIKIDMDSIFASLQYYRRSSAPEFIYESLMIEQGLIYKHWG